ncbi:MAG: hypothetical protein COW65_12235 [Cytophagales bacterium CG18_big_fil_WC_8_21_14_2_50_42_9]|nr:MAG: hypothetical protein COW65_12235 [Cytophagales bacterium CG18_big_fil_WC_8_21_14_2_50_42_9]
MKEVTKAEFERFTGGYYGGYKSKIDTNENPFVEYFYPQTEEKWKGNNHVAKIVYEEENNRYYIAAE